MMALKKLFAAALAASLPMATLAQATPAAPAPAAKPAAPAVTIYGTLNVNFQYANAGDATAGSAADIDGRTAVSIDSTNVGVRGALPLSDALKVEFQCETQASIDGLDVRGLCNRNSRIGLSGFWGTLFLGNWDTPFKAGTYGTKADDPFGNTDVFAYQGIMSSPGYNVRSGAYTGGANAGFDLRAANSVAYWTPKFAGLGARFQYGTNEARAGVVDPMLFSASVNYDIGGLSLVAAGELHEDMFGIRTMSAANVGNDSSRDMAWRVAAGYELPVGIGSLRIMGMFEQLMYEQEDATVGLTDYDRMAWLVGAAFRTGNHEFRARYSQALDPDVTAAAGTANEDDLGAMQYAVGYAYHLAKSTQLYAFYTLIQNDDAAQYTLSIGGPQNSAGGAIFASTPVGADPQAFGVGIRHAF